MFVLQIHTKRGVGSAEYEMVQLAKGNYVQLRHRGTGEQDFVLRRTVERWLRAGVARIEMVSPGRQRKRRQES